MAHPDHEIRIGSHRIFSAILMPTVTCPWSIPFISPSFNGYDPEGTHLIALSGFASSGVILDKLRFKNSCVNVSHNEGQSILPTHLDASTEAKAVNGAEEEVGIIRHHLCHLLSDLTDILMPNRFLITCFLFPWPSSSCSS